MVPIAAEESICRRLCPRCGPGGTRLPSVQAFADPQGKSVNCSGNDRVSTCLIVADLFGDSGLARGGTTIVAHLVPTTELAAYSLRGQGPDGGPGQFPAHQRWPVRL